MDLDEDYANIISKESIVILSKPNCKWCSELSSYLISRGIDFFKLDVNEYEYGIELVEYIKKKHNVQSFPICFKDRKFVGCKQELIDVLNERQFNDIENI
jgi:glutaredoxin